MNAKKSAARTLQRVEHYRFGDVLGEGTDSVVRLARSENDPSATFACKIIPKVLLVENKGFERFQLSLQILQHLQHPGIVRLHEVIKDALFYYVVLEYCPGALRRHISRRRKLELPEAKRLFIEILAAVAYVHSQNVAHRDLKPGNILLDDSSAAKVNDFGFAAILDNHGQCAGSVGTPGYASPECLYSKPYDGRKSDVWSAGVTFYMMTIGRLPWDSSSQWHMANQIRSGRFDIPANFGQGFAKFVKGMMHIDPKKRITAEEALNDPWLNGAEIPTPVKQPEHTEAGPEVDLDAVLQAQWG
jgi:serine/threonine protein kinase